MQLSVQEIASVYIFRSVKLLQPRAAMDFGHCYIAISGQSVPILLSGGLEFSYFGEDLDEAVGEPEESIAIVAVGERTAEHLHDVLSDD